MLPPQYATINVHSREVNVPLPKGWVRKTSGPCTTQDRYYVEHSRSFDPCHNSHTFLGIDASKVKLVITPASWPDSYNTEPGNQDGDA